MKDCTQPTQQHRTAGSLHRKMADCDDEFPRIRSDKIEEIPARRAAAPVLSETMKTLRFECGGRYQTPASGGK
jgi:hypothetical protein